MLNKQDYSQIRRNQIKMKKFLIIIGIIFLLLFFIIFFISDLPHDCGADYDCALEKYGKRIGFPNLESLS